MDAMSNGITFLEPSLCLPLPVVHKDEQTAAASAPQPLALKLNTSTTEDYPLKSRKIRYLKGHSLWFDGIPDVGMDKLLVTKGTPIGTSGVGPCFAIVCIGHALQKTARDVTQATQKTSVYGLCHSSGLVSFSAVLKKLVDEMVDQQMAIRETIRTYVIGGQNPSLESPEGCLAAEADILSLAKKEKIRGALFNLTNGDDDLDGLDILLKDGEILVSKKPMFRPYVEGVGTSIFDGNDGVGPDADCDTE